MSEYVVLCHAEIVGCSDGKMWLTWTDSAKKAATEDQASRKEMAMSIRVYLRRGEGMRLPSRSRGGGRPPEYFLDNGHRKRVFAGDDGTEFYFTMKSFGEQIPNFEWAVHWITKVTCYEQLPVVPARTTGRYVFRDASATLDRKPGAQTYDLRLTGKNFAEASVLHYAIRGGTIQPAESWEAEQVKKIPETPDEIVKWLQDNHFVNITGLPVTSTTGTSCFTVQVQHRSGAYSQHHGFTTLYIDDQCWIADGYRYNLDVIKALCPRGFFADDLGQYLTNGFYISTGVLLRRLRDPSA